MSDHNKTIKPFVCPACFAREIDVLQMRYDKRNEEYYCTKCTYVGTLESVEKFFADFKEQKYKDLRVPHEWDTINGGV